MRHYKNISILILSPYLSVVAATSLVLALLREGNEMSAVAFLWPGQAQLWRTRALCHPALMVCVGPSSLGATAERAAVFSLAVSLPGAALDLTNPSTGMLQNRSTG